MHINIMPYKTHCFVIDHSSNKIRGTAMLNWPCIERAMKRTQEISLHDVTTCLDCVPEQ